MGRPKVRSKSPVIYSTKSIAKPKVSSEEAIQVITIADHKNLQKALQEFQKKSKLLGTPQEKEVLHAIDPSIKDMVGSAQVKMTADEVLALTRGRDVDEGSD